MTNDPKKPIRREDRPGHLDPHYAASLLEKSGGHPGRDDQNSRAFLARNRAQEELAEELGEEGVIAMTSGQDQFRDNADRDNADEQGGPFVETSPNSEFAAGTDASNPADAEREPLPKV